MDIRPPTTGESLMKPGSSSPRNAATSSREDARSELVRSQMQNRYSNLFASPYIAFVEVPFFNSGNSLANRKYIGNLHPLTISKRLCNIYNNLKISEIKERVKTLLVFHLKHINKQILLSLIVPFYPKVGSLTYPTLKFSERE